VWESKRLLVLADTDEAALEANLQRLAETAPHVAVRVVDRGADVATGLTESDALLISGGGNLLGEPIEAIALAARRGIPVATGGQTIGPDLSHAERDALSGVLPAIAAVGVRDVPSAILVGKLGVPSERIFYQVDDAFDLLGVQPRDAELVQAATLPFIAVTLDATFVGPNLVGVASQLAVVARETGLRVVLIPGATDGAVAVLTGDLVNEMGAEATAVSVPSAAETVWLAQHAEAVVSSRLHPLVFGLAAGIPSLALYRDAHTRTVLHGALSHVGMRLWSVSAEDSDEGAVAVRFRDLWRHREPLRETVRELLPPLRRREARRWYHLLTRLGITPADTTSPGPAPVDWQAEALTLAVAFQQRSRLSD
jgi:polysaccharide pyruvyl transferase WcaK-like protein